MAKLAKYVKVKISLFRYPKTKYWEPFCLGNRINLQYIRELRGFINSNEFHNIFLQVFFRILLQPLLKAKFSLRPHRETFIGVRAVSEGKFE